MQHLSKFRPVWPVLFVGIFSISAWSDTIVVTNTAASGPGSFQQAILTANSDAGPDTIVFQITGAPPFTITPTSELPQISTPVIIDVTTQPGYAGKPVVELNGSATTANAIGLRFGLGSDGSVLRGLAINRFPGQGIDVANANSIVIQSNFIGTDVTGAVARGNGTSSNPGFPGIHIFNSSGNLIGGTNAGNVISGNYYGIYLQSADSNVIQGNIVGLNSAGTAALGNLSYGIIANPGSGNLIGGAVPGTRNVISGNGAGGSNGSGIFLNGGTNNVIQGNFIGTGASGSAALGNAAGDGVTIVTAENMVVSNLISGNSQNGVSFSGAGATGNRVSGNFIGTDITGKSSVANHFAGVEIVGGGGNRIGGANPGDGNLLSGNLLDGIALTGGTQTNTIQGNFIGVSSAGTNALRNSQNGISATNASFNLIGGTVAGARNVISGNAGYGIFIVKLSDTGNAVEGNYIGTDASGANAISNTLAGVQLQGSTNFIGGATAGAGNVISGNGQEGVFIAGNGGNVIGNTVQGNLIGLDATGTQRLGNYVCGIGVAGAANNLIGGASAGARNTISANGNSSAVGNGLGGVFFSNPGTTGNQLLGNFIGTDVSGTQSLGNFNDGVTLQQNAAGNYIGAPGAGNVISASAVDGIYLITTSSNVVQGNLIGTKADGTSSLGNVQQTVELAFGAINNFIGGTAPGEGNHVAFAQTPLYAGIRVRDGAYDDLISGNSIFGNAGLGIDLTANGVTANTDCESGKSSANANFGQNYPVLASVLSGAGTRIRGTLDAKAGKSYALQFFASPSGDANGYGEGQMFLGQANLTLGSLCSSNFTIYLPASVPTGWVVTATATDTNNNTSEFSAWISSLSVPAIQLTLTNQNQLAVAWTNNGGSSVLQQTYSLSPPVIWSTVTNAPILNNNIWSTTLAFSNLFVSPIFFRLAAQ